MMKNILSKIGAFCGGCLVMSASFPSLRGSFTLLVLNLKQSFLKSLRKGVIIISTQTAFYLQLLRSWLKRHLVDSNQFYQFFCQRGNSGVRLEQGFRLLLFIYVIVFIFSFFQNSYLKDGFWLSLVFSVFLIMRLSLFHFQVRLVIFSMLLLCQQHSLFLCDFLERLPGYYPKFAGVSALLVLSLASLQYLTIAELLWRVVLPFGSLLEVSIQPLNLGSSKVGKVLFKELLQKETFNQMSLFGSKLPAPPTFKETLEIVQTVVVKKEPLDMWAARPRPVIADRDLFSQFERFSAIAAGKVGRVSDEAEMVVAVEKIFPGSAPDQQLLVVKAWKELIVQMHLAPLGDVNKVTVGQLFLNDGEKKLEELLNLIALSQRASNTNFTNKVLHYLGYTPLELYKTKRFDAALRVKTINGVFLNLMLETKNSFVYPAEPAPNYFKDLAAEGHKVLGEPRQLLFAQNLDYNPAQLDNAEFLREIKRAAAANGVDYLLVDRCSGPKL